MDNLEKTECENDVNNLDANLLSECNLLCDKILSKLENLGYDISITHTEK